MKRALPLALLALILAWVGLHPPAGPSTQLIQREFPAMGTWVSVSIWVDDPSRRSAAEAAAAAVEQSMHAFDRRWKPDGDGELARLNADPQAAIPPAMQALIGRALYWYRLSNGLFDPRLGALISTWGFDQPENYGPEPPSAEALAAAMAAIAPPPERRRASGWNLGAIAKGWIVDRSIESLREQGFPNALVNAGGNLRVAGRRGDRAWRIAIRHPRPDERRNWLVVFDAHDEAIITSGDYERYFEFEGVRYHHILDPRSGQPARGLQSITVIADNATDADALSTALFVAGDQWPALAARAGLEQVLAVTADGELQALPAAAARFDFGGQSPTLVRP